MKPLATQPKNNTPRVVVSSSGPLLEVFFVFFPPPDEGVNANSEHLLLVEKVVVHLKRLCEALKNVYKHMK